MEVDEGLYLAEQDNEAGRYRDQRYGMILTGSSVEAPEYKRFKSGLIEIDSQKTAINQGQVLTLSEYLKMH